MPNRYRLYAGIDGANDSHQVFVADASGTRLAERSIEHSGRGLAGLADWLLGLVDGAADGAAIAIEVPRGPIVETRLDRGFHVFAINPKQLDRFRDRFCVAGAKDDRRDRRVLADSLRTDPSCFRRLQLEDPLTIQLRELSRVEFEIGNDERRYSNQLRDLLHRYFPQVLRLCPGADEPWAWQLLRRAPTPEAAARLRRQSVVLLLAEHRVRRLDAAQVLAELRAPGLCVAPGTTEAAAAHVALLLPRLQLFRQQRMDCAKRIRQLLRTLPPPATTDGERREHRDVDIRQSVPGVGSLTAATMLAEASQPLAAHDDHALRSHAGIAPVTRQSGKSRSVLMRRACNPRLRHATYHGGRCAIQRDDRARAHSRALRARGASHGRAIRGVVDRLLRILCAMLRERTLYDPRRVAPGAPAPALP